MKKTIAAIIIAISICFISCNDNKTEEADKSIDNLPVLLMQIQKCSRLYTTEYNVHKIITHDDKLTLQGSFMKKEYNIELPVGKRSIAIPMNATIKAYIDFSKFNKDNINMNGNKIEIILPDPKIIITGTRINHTEIKEYVAMLRHRFSDEELSSYERQGREAIVNEIPKMGITERARESAVKILVPIMHEMGINTNDVTITFRKKFNVADFNSLIDKTTIEYGKEKE